MWIWNLPLLVSFSLNLVHFIESSLTHILLYNFFISYSLFWHYHFKSYILTDCFWYRLMAFYIIQIPLSGMCGQNSYIWHRNRHWTVITTVITRVQVATYKIGWYSPAREVFHHCIDIQVTWMKWWAKTQQTLFRFVPPGALGWKKFRNVTFVFKHGLVLCGSLMFFWLIPTNMEIIS